MHAKRLTGMRVSLLGAGKVGLSLAAWSQHHGATLVSVASRSEASRRRAGELLAPARVVTVDQLAAGEDDLLLVAVADPALDEVVARLAQRPLARVALHASGSRDASVLDAWRPQGTVVGSLHPLRAFAAPLLDAASASNLVFGIDGDPEARALARRLATTWGGEAVEVPPAARLLYHYGATLAAGGVVGLLLAADTLRQRLALPPAVTRGYLELARGAVATVTAPEQLAPAVTGPLARGDVELVRRQLQAVDELAPELTAVGRALARTVLALLLEREPASDPRRSAQQALLIELAGTLQERTSP